MSTLTYAGISWLAYTPAGLPAACPIPSTGVQAVADGFICLKLESEIVFAFRGTADFADVVEDLDILHEHPAAELDPGVFVHRGFGKRYALYAPICVELAKTFLSDHNNATLTCTGHSSGAAVATLCAYDMSRKFPDANVRCVTFGSPPLGNICFVDRFTERVKTSIRVAHKLDPIPKHLSVYSHVPIESTLHGPHSVQDWISYFKHVMRSILGRNDPFDLHYHTLKVYIQCLLSGNHTFDVV